MPRIQCLSTAQLMGILHQASPGQMLLGTMMWMYLCLSVVYMMKDTTDVLLIMALVIQPAGMSSSLFKVSQDCLLVRLKLYTINLGKIRHKIMLAVITTLISIHAHNYYLFDCLYLFNCHIYCSL